MRVRRARYQVAEKKGEVAVARLAGSTAPTRYKTELRAHLPLLDDCLSHIEESPRAELRDFKARDQLSV